MNDIKKKIQEGIHDFFKENYDKITVEPKYLEFESWDQMLEEILSIFEVATWAMTEIPQWYMPVDLENSFISGNLDDEYETAVYKVNDIYFTMGDNYDDIQLKKCTTKLIEVLVWEDL